MKAEISRRKFLQGTVALSVIASSNEELHSILLMMIDRGFNKLEENIGRY